MKKILILFIVLISLNGYSQQSIKDLTIRNKLTVVNEIELDDSSVIAITEGDTLATKEWTIENAAILTGNPNEIFFNSSGILGSSLRFTYNPLDSTMIVDSLQLGAGAKLSWNADDYTINIPTGIGAVLQVGQERYTVVYNGTGSTLLNGTVVSPVGVVNGRPSVDKAIANTHLSLIRPLSILTMDIPDGQEGISTGFGYVRDLNTTGYILGQEVYLSPTDSGELVTDKPGFPDYPVRVGGTTKTGVTDGELFIRIDGDPNNTVVNFWNGVFRETFDFLITESGGVITGTLTPTNGHPDMTMMFSDGFTMLDTDPGATIVLTAGTNVNPQTNYVYIPESTKVLTVSTSEWPTIEHIKVAQVLLQSAITTANNGALRNQNWNDAIQNTTTFQGHLSHITEKLRQFEAQWSSGIEGSSTIDAGSTPDDVWISSTAGVTYQLHKQAFRAFDTETGDSVYIANHSATPYLRVNNLNTQLLDASGNTLNNTSFSFVLWGVANKTGDSSHVMINLPSNSYAFASPDDAVSDALNYTVYNIPNDFQGVGFLIARFTYTYKNNDWVLYDTEDLRGFIPNATAGGGAGGAGVTTFLGLTDTESSYTAYEFQVANAGGTALESPLGLKYYGDSLVVDSSIIAGKNIGIGTSTPLSALHVKENARIDSNLLIGDSLYVTKLDQDFVNGTFFISNKSDFTTIDNTDTESGEFNTYIGYKSGLNTTKAKKNTALGYNSGTSVTEGWANTLIGYNAGATGVGDFTPATTAFYANTFVGANAGFYTTTGSYNVFFGVDAGLQNTVGYNNTFLGVHAGDHNIGGVTNVAIGTRAGYSNTASSNIISIGNNAGYSNTGATNIFVGTDAGYFNTTAQNNISIGYRSGYNNVAGASNVFIGNNAGLGGSAGNYAGNVFIGDVAGTAITASCNFNVGIGKNSGDHITGGDNNVLLGYQSGDNITTGSSNIMIGSGIDADVATGSNQLNIGDKIKGDANNLNLFAGGKEIARASENVTEQFIINPQGDLTGTAAAPSLAFGDGNTGFYEAVDNQLNIAVTGVAEFGISTAAMGRITSTNGGIILDDIPTATTCAFSFVGDINTGIGKAGTDQLSLIANSIEAMRLTEDTVYVDSILIVGEKIGIGTLTPLFELDVIGNTRFSINETTTAFNIQSAEAGGDPVLRIDDTSNKLFLIDDQDIGYKIGIGIATPNQLLDIDGNVNIRDTLFLGDSSATVITEGDTLATKKYVDDNIISSTGVMQIVKAEVLYTNTNQTTIIALSTDAVVTNIAIDLITTFNGSGTDFLEVGLTADSDFFTSETVGTAAYFFDKQELTGLVNVPPERITSGTNVTFKYLDQNSDASAGQAFVYIYYTIF